jgi:hypothetical protein
MYIKENHRISREELEEVLNSLEVDGDVPLSVIVQIYHVYHNQDDDYEGGLGFLNRLHHKLSMYFDIQWDLDGIKSIIRESSKPEEEFYGILHQMLTPEMIAVYGV